ncbi:AAA family ATPase [Streptomyces osmaniensis]|uniref:MoxR family ATPase n=1 Tax=Streptomyces osmaniensis TaxID=593134 RepID=A0ABP6Z2C2_9ACTN|nr:MoxR family ATPase [Streptomyces sp. JCM17656]
MHREDDGVRATEQRADRSEDEGVPPNWWIYQGTGLALPEGTLASRLPAPPQWRTFAGGPVAPPPPEDEDEVLRRLGRELPVRTLSDQIRHEADMVNAAIYLRRPLLVTGKPGTGKSALAYRISRELGLGRVLRWHITSRTTLRSGLYEYDAIGRVQDAAATRRGPLADGSEDSVTPTRPEIGEYLQLGPLGTALLPYAAPRVLLIDELDKSDLDLANDLLSVFEEGKFTVPELVRLRRREPRTTVLTDDPDGSAVITDGTVQCRAFPIVVITSNGEREFPAAFLRRLLRLHMPEPDHDRLAAMVAAHFTGQEAADVNSRDLLQEFVRRSRERGGLAADQLLNSAYLTLHTLDEQSVGSLVDALWHRLDAALPEAGPS